MSFKSASLFYSITYSVVAVILLFANRSTELEFGQIVMFDLPILLAVSLLLNYYIYKATQGKESGFVNALMLTSMGRLVSFGTVLVATVFIWRETIIPSAIIISLLYLISTGADSYFAKRFS